MKEVLSEDIDFLEATERICEDCPWLVPLYYLRVSLAVNEIINPSTFPEGVKLKLQFLRDDYRAGDFPQAELDDVFERLKLALPASGFERLFQLHDKNDIDIVSRLGYSQPQYRLLRGLNDVERFTETFHLNAEGRGIGGEYADLFPHGNPYIVLESSASEEHFLLKKAEEISGEAPIAFDSEGKYVLVDELSRALSDYKFLSTPHLLLYRATMEDFVKVCLWKRFPIPDEYRPVNDDGAFDEADNFHAEQSDSWELSKAISTVFGDIGRDWQIEAKFIRALTGEEGYVGDERISKYYAYAESMRENGKTPMSLDSLCISHTMEYDRARVAIGAGVIEGFQDKENGSYHVKPSSFLGWVTTQGVSIPNHLRPLLVTASRQGKPTNRREGSKDAVLATGRPRSSASSSSEKSDEEVCPVESPAESTRLEYRTEEVAGVRTLVIWANHRSKGKSQEVRFGPGLQQKLIEILLTKEGVEGGIVPEVILRDVYGIDAKALSQAWIQSHTSELDSGAGGLSDLKQKAYDEVLRKSVLKLQSLVEAIREKLWNAGINREIIPQVTTKYTSWNSKLKLCVAGTKDFDDNPRNTHRGVSLDKVRSIGQDHPYYERRASTLSDAACSQQDEDFYGSTQSESGIEPTIAEDDDDSDNCTRNEPSVEPPIDQDAEI